MSITSSGPIIVPLTIDQYHRMIQSRILPEDPSVELLDGLLVRKDRGVKGGDKMTVGPAHNLVIKKLTRLAPRIDALQCHLQTQGPIAIPPSSEPEPDAAVVRGSPEDYATSVPEAKDAVVVIEVADSSLDRSCAAGKANANVTVRTPTTVRLLIRRSTIITVLTSESSVSTLTQWSIATLSAP